MISTVLVANRGEIACRVFRTCRDLGIATVAVHSDADADALHVREADAAVRLPGAAPAETYLRGGLIVQAALAAGADAVHPGYGFLSENADFARAVTDAGLRWIGPPPEAIEAMASKTRAKKLMGLAPLDPASVTEADLPVLVKAAAGGGGRGMRVVRSLADLAVELEAARSEAASAFGDGEVFVEPYVENGRHVEVQIMADAHGTVWALGTRDCSLQRRHQKVIEESPAPGLAPELAETLNTLAVGAARAVDYRGAGTVEFLVDTEGRAHFLEMNTRLQVEHPVTEAVFGVDLVALQLAVAEGEPLPPKPPRAAGHAIEARLYAEDPASGWAPQTGRLHTLRFPDATDGTSGGRAHAPSARALGGRAHAPSVRVDAGYGDGDVIGVHYDAMVAKVVVWAPTRAQAVRRLASTLRGARIHGPRTNRDLLVASLEHPDFTGGRLDTGFYGRHLDELTRPVPGEANAAVAAAIADAVARQGAARSAAGPASGVPQRLGAWRNLASQAQLKTYGDHEIGYRPTRDGGFELVDRPGVRVVSARPDRVALETDGVVRNHDVAFHGGTAYVDSPAGAHALTARPRFTDPRDRAVPGSLLAPMPGTVVRVGEGVVEGARVAQGQPLVWLEAMKMEHRILSPASGTLTALHAVLGRQVEVGALLAVVTEEAQEDTAS
ncbi:biotin carboxylase N-terminal domain-containing protein [Streptomyces sp. NPDC048389]|uniref:acetyl/propionyl/methylcrotonyl-CoA carboxylase subunit alpha n=1 Tax=Streptomyces sp. NPDC048389 TaxID=3154622 RepID=UPI0034559245